MFCIGVLNCNELYPVIILAFCVITLFSACIYFIMKIRNQNDITKMAKMEEEKYRVVSELSNDILFEFDIRSDTMRYAEKYSEIFGRKPIIYHYTEYKEDFRFIHDQDLSVYESYIKMLFGKKQAMEAEFRILDVNKEYVWCHIMGKTVYDSMNNPIKIIGKVVNIDVQKKEFERLQYKAQMDPLTAVYNKVMTKERIDEFLKESRLQDKHALMVIDIDDFKEINDCYGHLLGDKVLSSAISHIKNMFREQDVVGRVGGDEFVVFMTRVNSQDDIVKKVTSLGQAFKNNSREEDENIVISGSIGIALYPRDGENYEELFDKADRALYKVKAKGKNNYTFYSEE